MKIAITGHSSGMGQALTRQYKQRGHTVIGLSKRDGNDIRNINRVADQIESCDMFINNAQQGFAQTDLLFEIHNRWKGQEGKEIIVISTMMTMSGPDCDEHIPYYSQKVALENASLQLALSTLWPKITLIRPGEVNTGPHSSTQACDVDAWAESMINIIESVKPGLRVYEFALGVDYGQ